MIILNSSFRSGSTYFWRMLRDASHSNIYYEPLNRRLLELSQRGSFVDTKSRRLHGADVWDDYQNRTSVISKYFESLEYGVFPQSSRKVELYFKALSHDDEFEPIFQTNRLHFSLAYFLSRHSKVIQLLRNPADVYESMINGMSASHHSGFMRVSSRLYHRHFNHSPFELAQAFEEVRNKYSIAKEKKVNRLQKFLYVWVLSNHAAVTQVKGYGGVVISYDQMFNTTGKRQIEDALSQYLELPLKLKDLKYKPSKGAPEELRLESYADSLGLEKEYFELMDYIH